jgi:hypothetical protein
VKFIADVNLGKLAKWLRIFGYNTVFYPENADKAFLRKAEREGRVALTRKKPIVRGLSSGGLVIIQSDTVFDQLVEIMGKLPFIPEPDRMFSICVRCNEELMEVDKEEVSGMVPDYIFVSHTEFRMCLHCKRVFWRGTHSEKAQHHLKMHIQSYPL